jgi:hypothetical protein
MATAWTTWSFRIRSGFRCCSASRIGRSVAERPVGRPITGARGVFSQPEHAAGELRSILPADVARRSDWSALWHLPESFIDPELGELRAARAAYS